MPTFGEIDGYPGGSHFDDRWSLYLSGVRRPPQAGIAGTKNSGGAGGVYVADSLTRDLPR